MTHFHNWLKQFIKESGHQWGFGFYVETIDGKVFHQGTDEYKDWYDSKLEEYKQNHMRKLKRSHKNLMVLEAGYIYCKRHGLNYETFIDDVFMDPMAWNTDRFDSSEGSEFDKICKDLRCYRYFDSHRLIEITDDEYEMCVDEFGEF